MLVAKTKTKNKQKKNRKIPKTQNTSPIPYWFALCEDIPSTIGQAWTELED